MYAVREMFLLKLYSHIVTHLCLLMKLLAKQRLVQRHASL